MLRADRPQPQDHLVVHAVGPGPDARLSVDDLQARSVGLALRGCREHLEPLRLHQGVDARPIVHGAHAGLLSPGASA
ncbi:hypothetical protein [Streptomyces beihaiensis]|uniref:Uncharacterized protein n=1 Tax=Streptomyces beihaiensis TaxID=2984495 RepID=A0ABT3TTS4_9ACTN|nr:hypothetical protein [Streptomyces beihaiensis]MCX3060438.1 hypothetical protein [Streptomyces beihaiensis]